MAVDSIEICCGKCGIQLDDPPDLPIDLRKPCPTCGSLSRQAKVGISARVELHSKLKLKGKRPGLKRPFIEQTVGDDLHKKTGRWMKLHRVIDRLANWYSERVVDPESGKEVHNTEEPLTDHLGHGSDQKKQKSP